MVHGRRLSTDLTCYRRKFSVLAPFCLHPCGQAGQRFCSANGMRICLEFSGVVAGVVFGCWRHTFKSWGQQKSWFVFLLRFGTGSGFWGVLLR